MDPNYMGPSTRWNPTKEQLSLLESLYNEGIRTPTAEQIQSITKRLQVYGRIKGKNVFYWFQNRKGRPRRQKQKVERQQKMDQRYKMISSNTGNNNNSNNNNNNKIINNLNNNHIGNVAVVGFLNRFSCPTPKISPTFSLAAGRRPLFHTTPRSVAHTPYHIAQPEFEFYPHGPAMVLQNHIMNHNTPMSLHPRNVTTFSAQSNAPSDGLNDALFGEGSRSQAMAVTLDLFPMKPIGILQHKDPNGAPGVGSSTENGGYCLAGGQTSSSSTSGVGFDFFCKLGVLSG